MKQKLFMEMSNRYHAMYPNFVEQFRADGYDVCFITRSQADGMSEEKRAELMKDCTIASVCGSPVTRRMIEAAPNLKLICTFGAGYNHIAVDAATERKIPVVNGRGGGAVSVSEMVVSMMMALARKLPELNRQMQRGEWVPTMGSELHGKTVGILGVGAIGAETVRLLHDGFLMKVLICDVVEREEMKQKFGAEYVDIDTLFRESDFISIHTPLLPSTRKIVSREKIWKMKPSAFLVNASRGGIIDEEALYDALAEKRIAGAGLDVFENEPYKENRFKKFKNVITTPHCANDTPEMLVRISASLTENIRRVLVGERPSCNVVNPEIYSER